MSTTLYTNWAEVLSVTMAHTYCTNKAGVMPGVTKGIQELVSSFDWELTAMAASPKQIVEVFQKAKDTVAHIKQPNHGL